jgi:uncharacterized protein YbcI
MTDGVDLSPETKASELTDEINRALGSVWKRHAGERPTSISTEINGDVIRCTIEGHVADASTEEEEEAEAEEVVLLTVDGQKSEAISSIRRATHRKVIACFSKRDDKAGVSTQTFILDRDRKRY